jgi:hypothetical protein
MTDTQQILRDRDAETAAIDGNPELTREAKEGRKRVVREWAKAEYEAAREKERVEREARLENTKRSVYRIPTGYGSNDAEIAQIHASFRSAWADVTSATEGEAVLHAEERLGSITDYAERTGDYLLARAASHRALDLGTQPIVDRFLSTRETDAAAYQRYVEAKGQAEQVTSFGGLLSGVMTNNLF